MFVTTLRISEQEQDLIQAALRFANLKIKSAGQVEKLFMPFASGIFQSIAQTNHDGAPYRNDQAAFRNQLLKITSNGVLARQEVMTEVAEQLATIPAKISFKDGRLIYIYGTPGIQGMLALALALVLDESRGIVNRLGYCAASGCGKFRLDFVGKPRRFCSDEHRYKFDLSQAAVRIRAWRKRNPKQKTKGDKS